MSRRAFAISFVALVAWAGACTLNPQPLPPGDDKNTAMPPDGARADSGATGGGGADAGSQAPDGAPNLDMDASRDAVAPPPADAAADGGTDAGDASTDAGDASSDAVSD
jgi:hypothetical protein